MLSLYNSDIQILLFVPAKYPLNPQGRQRFALISVDVIYLLLIGYGFVFPFAFPIVNISH